MKPEDVASYLQQHPEFFEQYADALAEIFIPHPHGGRTISISERQILTLREKSKQLEAKLREIIQFGEENDAIGEKTHRLTLALLAARDLSAVLSSVYLNLREDFAVPHVVLRAWRTDGRADLPEFSPVSGAVRDFAASLTHPYCCAHAMVDTATLFGEAAPHLRSFSYVPLRAGEVFGLLALASEDPQRFYPEMGTLYLKRLGELIAAALAWHLNA
ncbi:MAG: hypothetical protein A3F74_15580 [Betaproteobacteria bacterium RIFCSPLOWO2_12_FULL_62_58]|nr:MAG: hypothetical protein A3F74_15580 [Betaproteobacteria bacterium RIFCSPLOWO2_12_FULL_62_58]